MNEYSVIIQPNAFDMLSKLDKPITDKLAWFSKNIEIVNILPHHVLFDELKVLTLAYRRTKGFAAIASTLLGHKIHGQSLPQPLYEQGRAINKNNGQLSIFVRLDVGYTFSANQFRNVVGVQRTEPPICVLCCPPRIEEA